MNTRGFSIIFLIVGVIFMSCSNKSTTEEQTTTRRPNIIYILADDLGYGDLSCYGQTKFSTPNIDKLASEGIRFTQHYAGTTVCAPSRSSLMTGLHTGHTPIRGNKEWKPEGQWPIPADTYTMAEMLKENGYVTGAFGKWGLGYPGSEGDPNNQGFDEFYGYNCQRLAHSQHDDAAFCRSLPFSCCQPWFSGGGRTALDPTRASRRHPYDAGDRNGCQALGFQAGPGRSAFIYRDVKPEPGSRDEHEGRQFAVVPGKDLNPPASIIA